MRLKTIGTAIVMAAIVGGLSAIGSARAEGPATAVLPQGKQAIEKIVRDYIRDNPEIVIQAIELWRAKQRASASDRARAAVASSRAALFDDPDAPKAGNLKGDVTIVEFFDYRCPYCKRSMPGFMKMVKEDGNVRIVFKEFPILGPVSRIAAQAALASRKQGKYFVFHKALMAAKVALTERVIYTIAASVGLDVARLKKDMQAPAIKRSLARNFELANKLGIRGTPAFVVGKELIPGAIDAAGLKRLVAKARKKS